jgi:hypothetical protein
MAIGLDNGSLVLIVIGFYIQFKNFDPSFPIMGNQPATNLSRSFCKVSSLLTFSSRM